MGTTFWGRYMNDWSNASDLGVAYPFSRLAELDRDAYDAWIAGLECPTVAGLDLDSATQEELLVCNCPPEYLTEAAKWFTAFTLANNHTDNQGAEGFEETKQHLDEAGIQHFSHYDPRELDQVCGALVVPVTVTTADGGTRPGELPLAMCGYHGVFMLIPEDSLDLITHYGEYFPVIAMPHSGAEYKAGPDQIKTTQYRAMIDRGAEMVLGDHPHWVQTAEVYHDHLIVYSMGNFMFDQQRDEEVTRSAAVDVTITASVADNPDLEAWLALAPECRGDLDGCYDKAAAAGLEKLHLTYDVAIVGTNDQDHLTHRATPEQQAAIEQRLGWPAVSEALAALDS
jgi:poly-gamma-glutamate synthesis protein (capsule biosynthesis protein)